MVIRMLIVLSVNFVMQCMLIDYNMFTIMGLIN